MALGELVRQLFEPRHFEGLLQRWAQARAFVSVLVCPQLNDFLPKISQ